MLKLSVSVQDSCGNAPKITDDLVNMLRNIIPYGSYSFQPSCEITPESSAACNKLADAR